ncbi:hypothetical protein NXV95_06910 [Bacteroides fragilis]|nr:hypothetical protein [Bacteroides fragilis]
MVGSTLVNDGRSSNGVFQRYNRTLETLTTQTQLTYIKTFAQKHNLDALLGFETKTSQTRGYILMVLSIHGYKNEIANAGETSSNSNRDKSRLTFFLRTCKL